MESNYFDNISRALENIDDSNYIDKIINSFSYSDRFVFFREICFSKQIAAQYINVTDKIKYLLTQDEIAKIISERFGRETVNSMIDSSNRKYLLYLFNYLNDDNKVSEFLKLDRTLKVYTCNNIFNTDELRRYFIYRLSRINNFDDSLNRVVVSIINNIEDTDLKLKCIDSIVNAHPKIYLDDLINNIDKNKMDHYFNDLGLSDVTKSMLILKCPDATEAKKYFLKLDADMAKVNAARRFSLEFINITNDYLDGESGFINKNFSFEDLKEMFLSFKDKNNRMLMLHKYEDFEKFKFLSLLSEEEKIELLSNMSDYKLLFKGLDYLSGILSITRVLTFYKGEFPKYKEDYDKLLTYYSKICGVNTKHLIELSKVTSLEIINSLSNKNVKSLINMNDNDFNKFVSLFNETNTKLTGYTLNNIFDAFANKSFNLNYEYIMHYYTDVMLYSQKNDIYSAKEIIRKVLRELGEDSSKGYTTDSLYNALVNNDQGAIKDFHNFCNKYINSLRKQEVETSVNMYKDEYLDVMYEASSSIKAIIEHGDFEWIFEYLSRIKDEFSLKEKSLFEDKELFNQIYEFKLNPVGSPPPIIKTNMFIFNKIMDKFYNIYKSDHRVVQILSDFSVKKVPVIPDIDVKFLIDIMSYLNANELKTKLLDDEGLCKELNDAIKKYSFLAFNRRFEDIQLDADTYCDAETVASIFLNYKDIIKELKKSNIPISMSSILDSADMYNKSSKVYKNLFEEDNFRLITLNPPMNRANSLRQERREESLKNYINCYNRIKVAVPSFDEDIDIGGKKINAVVGNFTNPINLTLGERTGSCMRSGGIGEDLYNFCLNDDHGFHIVLFDSETGKLISRSSGFRNGNTIFLNQLRESVLGEYESQDLIKALKNVTDKIVARSKSSGYPIDNVVISCDKAMEEYEGETENIGIQNIFDGMSKHFWFDILPNNAVVLSSSNNGELVPVELGDAYISYYPVQRDKIRLADNPIEAVNHIEAIDQLLCGKRIEDIKLLEDEFEVCYYGEDWYVAIDKDGNILKKVMRKSKDFESAFKEMEIVLNDLENVENIFAKNKL